MGDISTLPLDRSTPASSGVVRFIAPALFLTSLVSVVSATANFRTIAKAATALAIFAAAALPGRAIIMLFPASRPNEYGQRRNLCLVVATRLAAASILPTLFVTN
jgi:hypothetical protein